MSDSDAARPDQQRIAVAVVRRGDEYLIGQRPSGATLAGYWEFPGGKVHPDETPAQAAVRECLEETGLCVRVAEPLAVVEHEYRHGRLELHFFACVPCDSGEPRFGLPSVPSAAAAYQWTPAARLGDYEFPAANVAVVNHILAQHRPQ